MIRRFLGLFLFIIISFTFCVLSSMALKSNSKLEHYSFQGSNNISKPILRREENQGVGRVRYYLGNHVMRLESSEKKRGKGRGVYGGGNVAHRPRPVKSIASPLPPATAPMHILTVIITLLQLVQA